MPITSFSLGRAGWPLSRTRADEYYTAEYERAPAARGVSGKPMTKTPPQHQSLIDPALATPEQLFREAQALTAKQFAQRYPHAFLVPEFEPEAGPAAVEPMEEWAQWGDTPTGITQLEEARAQAGLGKQVFAIRKVQTLYQDMITVGRTANHDVVLRDPSVSKFHAHFKLRPSGLYLVDAGSTRGTFVDGKRLWPRDTQL